jgi:hypothetical protein
MPSWKQLKRFCEQDGWDLYKKTDHYFYQKLDETGVPRRTKVSMGSGEIGTQLWQDILHHQLRVTQAYFNEKS